MVVYDNIAQTMASRRDMRERERERARGNNNERERDKKLVIQFEKSICIKKVVVNVKNGPDRTRSSQKRFLL